jgi:hypothetical protein
MYTKSQTISVHVATLTHRLGHDTSLSSDQIECIFAEIRALSGMNIPPECPIEVHDALMRARTVLRQLAEYCEYQMQYRNSFGERAAVHDRQQLFLDHHARLGHHLARLQQELHL